MKDFQKDINIDICPLRGYCTPNQKLAGFVLHLKIVNAFMKNNKCIL